MNMVYLGIDLAKNAFQLCELNQADMPVYSKCTGQKGLLQTVANIPACLVSKRPRGHFTGSVSLKN